LASEVVGFDS
jgi:ribonuclease D